MQLLARQKACIALAATLFLSACATTSPAFRADQQAAAAQDLGIAASDLMRLSRCQFGQVPLGATVANFRSGVCAATKDTIIVRSLDYTTGKSRPFTIWAFKEIDSVSLYSGVVLDQVQVRQSGEMLVMIMRPDGGGGFNNGAAREMFEHLSKSGVQIVESKAAIGFAATGGTYVPMPIIIPMKK